MALLRFTNPVVWSGMDADANPSAFFNKTRFSLLQQVFTRRRRVNILDLSPSQHDFTRFRHANFRKKTDLKSEFLRR